MGFFSPEFLVKNITIIAIVISVVFLVIISNFLNYYVIQFTDGVKDKIYELIIGRSRRSSNFRHQLSSFLGSILAATIFILYCYFGSYILSEYLLTPILERLKEYILVIVIILFLIFTKFINHDNIRRKVLGV